MNNVNMFMNNSVVYN